jgi:hypothetical protein
MPQQLGLMRKQEGAFWFDVRVLVVHWSKQPLVPMMLRSLNFE